MFGQQFYPTPPELAEKMLAPYFANGPQKRLILEPSAGSGALIEAATSLIWKWMEGINEKTEEQYKARPDRWTMGRYYGKTDAEKEIAGQVHACEIDPDLAAMLAGKNVTLVGTDFLKYETPLKYDLIMMNPPFATGVSHVLRAWDMVAPGGHLVALLNADTVLNRDTAALAALRATIERHGSTEIIEGAFVDAKRPTGVSVALIRMERKAESSRNLFDDPSMAYADLTSKVEEGALNGREVATRDVVGTLLRQYQAAHEYYVEYRRACRTMRRLKDVFDFHGEEDTIKDPYSGGNDGEEYSKFVIKLTTAAWRTVFRLTGMKERMTEKVRLQFEDMEKKAQALAFTRENIAQVLTMLVANSETIMKDCILDCFDLLTRYHKDNREEVEGWKTNDAYRVRRKCILPSCVEYSPWEKCYRIAYRVENGLVADLDKAMCFLAGRRIEDVLTIKDAVRARGKEMYESGGDSKCESEFFSLRFFKKGTLHLTFKDEQLWQRFNQFVARERGWLPGETKSKRA